MKSLDKALSLLSEFSGTEAEFGVGELALRTGMPKSQVSKILATFRKHRILEQDPQSHRYRVDAKAFALGSRFVNHSKLVRAAMPTMRDLAIRSNHSSRLSIRVDDDVLYLVSVEGPHFIETGWRAGQWMPMHAASAARVLLAFYPPEKIREILDKSGMTALTPETIRDPDALMALLAEVRSSGVARNRDETAIGLSTLSVPVLGARNEPIAALTLAFPSKLVTPAQEQPLIDLLHEGARTVSYKIGCSIYRFGSVASGLGVDAPREAAARLPHG